MQEDFKKIKESLLNWNLCLARALETNAVDDVSEVLKQSKVVECACDQLVYSLNELKENIEEQEAMK
jgi:hypothetical protein